MRRIDAPTRLMHAADPRLRTHLEVHMKIRNALVVSAATLALTVGITPSAWAADHTLYSADVITVYEDPGAKVEFTEYGDIVTLCDNDADGKLANVVVYRDDEADGFYGVKLYEKYVGGEGNCRTYRASNGYNLPEGHNIGFLVCVASSRETDGQECNYRAWLNDH
jgi:hypothetical protein